MTLRSPILDSQVQCFLSKLHQVFMQELLQENRMGFQGRAERSSPKNTGRKLYMAHLTRPATITACSTFRSLQLCWLLSQPVPFLRSLRRGPVQRGTWRGAQHFVTQRTLQPNVPSLAGFPDERDPPQSFQRNASKPELLSQAIQGQFARGFIGLACFFDSRNSHPSP